MVQTKNDLAWEQLFKKYKILDEIKKKGFYKINAEQKIREFREPRLMCKFDHKSNLPEILAKNNLTVLPLSAKSYIIGDFDLFKKVDYDESTIPKQMKFPDNIDTIKPTDLYSEAAALHCAYISGMIDDFLGEECSLTVSGRMRSKEFQYNILSSNGAKKLITVDGAQIEIDGTYESKQYFMLIEAKNKK